MNLFASPKQRLQALLQKALRDEHEKVKLELGIDAKTEEDRADEKQRAKNLEHPTEASIGRRFC